LDRASDSLCAGGRSKGQGAPKNRQQSTTQQYSRTRWEARLDRHGGCQFGRAGSRRALGQPEERFHSSAETGRQGAAQGAAPSNSARDGASPGRGRAQGAGGAAGAYLSGRGHLWGGPGG